MSCVNAKNYDYVIDVLTEDAVTRFGMTEERARSLAERDWESIVAENSSREEFEAYKALSARSDKTVDVYFNGSKMESLKVTGVDKISDGYIVHMFGDGKKYSYNFLEGQERSRQTAKGSYVVVPMMKTLGNMYRSEAEVNIDEDVFTKQELDLVNNLDNASALFDRLSMIDDSVSTEHNSRLKRVLESVVDDVKKYIPDMNVYLNEEAEKNGGALKTDDGIYLNINQEVSGTKNEMSAQEVYVHELVHAATVFAKTYGASGVASTIRRLQQLRQQLRNEITIEDLMPVESVDKQYEKEIAEKTWNYIFNNKNTGLEEFVAYGLTNEAIAQKLDTLMVNKVIDKVVPESIFERLLYLVRDLINSAMIKVRRENSSTTGTELLVKLTREMAEANNKALNEDSTINVLDIFREKSEELNEKMSSIIKDKLLKMDSELVLPRTPAPGATKADWIKYAWKIGPRLIGDKRLRPAWREILNGLGMSYVGDVQTAMNNFVSADTLQRAVEKMGLLSENVDKARETRARITADQIRRSFGEISKAEREALTLGALDIDLSSIYDMVDSLPNMLRNDEALRSEIETVRRELRADISAKEHNYLMYQAEGLGHYMATHKTTPNQRLNAKMIEMGMHKGIGFESNEEMVRKIDKLATLYGMWYTNPEARNLVAGLIEREPDGMRFTMELHNSVKSMAADTAFANNENLMIKGYTKEIFDNDITMQIAPLSSKLDMAKEGFELVRPLEKAKGDTSSVQMAMYLNKAHAQQNYKKAAMRLTDMNRKGTTLLDIRNIGNETLAYEFARRDTARISAESAKTDAKIENGQMRFNPKDTGGLVALYNQEGEVVNYRYMMDKRTKRELLGQDIKGPTVLGRMQAVIEDKISTEEHNDKVFDIIQRDMDKNYIDGASIGRNSQRYAVIEANSTNKEIREIYRLLPKELRERIAELPNNKMAVRADLVRFYFGMREASTLDMISKIPGIGASIVAMTPKEVRYMIQIAEMIWQSIVGIAKVDIVIRTPAVLIGNMISNFAYSVQSGYSPLTVLRMQLDAAKGLKEYIDMTHEIVRMENEKAVGKLAKKDWDKLNLLKEDLKKHPANELVDEGMFQAIIEDVGSDEYKTTNKIGKYFDKKLENMPQYIQDGAQWLYLTEKTQLFRMMSTATQFSDFIARQVHHSLNKERYYAQIDKNTVNGMVNTQSINWMKGYERVEAQKISRKEAYSLANDYSREQVLDAFINYSKPEGKVIDYMNRMGLVMFTKYFMRIQRAIGKNFVDNPLYMIMSLLGQHMLYDVDSVDDQMLLVKDLGYLWKNPVDMLEHFIMPSGLDFVLHPVP